VKAPVALVAMSALAALSVAIQAHTDVQRAVKAGGAVQTVSVRHCRQRRTQNKLRRLFHLSDA
jgi:hypothetical protein